MCSASTRQVHGKCTASRSWLLERGPTNLLDIHVTCQVRKCTPRLAELVARTTYDVSCTIIKYCSKSVAVLRKSTTRRGHHSGTTGCNGTATSAGGTIESPMARSSAASTELCQAMASSAAPVLDAHASASRAAIRASIASLLSSEVLCRRGSGREGVLLPERVPETVNGMGMPGRPVPH